MADLLTKTERTNARIRKHIAVLFEKYLKGKKHLFIIIFKLGRKKVKSFGKSMRGGKVVKNWVIFRKRHKTNY